MTSREIELRAVVAAPTGRDGEFICDVLASQNIPFVLCTTADGARMEARAGAGVVVIAEEALNLPEIAL